MGLFTIFASCLGLIRRKRTSLSEQLQAKPMSPRTLERRRVLDASAAGAVLTPLAELSDTIQAGDYAPAETDGNEEVIALPGISENTPPSNLVIQPLDPVLENGFAELSLSFEDPDFEDAHTVEIDWGDGSAVEVINLEEDQLSLVTQHQYLDDDPTGTPSDMVPIMVTVTDSYGESVSESATVEVINVDPQITSFSVSSPVDENGEVTLQLAFEDVGTLDNHTVSIDWGDGGAVEIINLGDDEFSLVTMHTYLDDNPSGDPSNDYTVTVTVTDDDTGSDSAMAMVTVDNVDPVLMLNPLANINENGSTTLSGNVSDVGTLDTFQLDIDWGDPLSPDNMQSFMLGNMSLTEAVDGIDWDPVTGDFSISHQYLDDNPSGDASNIYTVGVTVTDDDTGSAMAMEMLTVSNVAPNVTINGAPLNSPEGIEINLTSTVVDPGSLDTFTYAWEVSVGGNVVATGSDPTFSFTPADDGTYLVKLEVTDDDGGAGMDMVSIEVMNVEPTLAPIENITADEGEFISLPPATFSDPGFDLAAAGTEENFTATIDWGDGTTEPVGDITLVEVPGSEGVLTTGTIQAMHAYADNGTYTVTVTVNDDDGGSASQMFEVTVGNVNPTLDPIENITADEGEFISLPPATFSDPGFDLAAAGTEENFTATIDWGDGTTEPVGDITLVEVPGSEGVLTTGTIQAMHAYADNGTYTVTVTVNDDDGGSASQMFEVTVGNVNPTLDPIENITADEGEFISLPPATFSDPGFDLAAAGTEENFTATIDWGDGTTEPVGDITLVEVPGSEGVLTTGTIQAMHAYADNGTYTVTVTVNDDDGGSASQMFEVTVGNVNPTLDPIENITADEGEFISLPPATFSDPGFDLAAAGTEENFTATIDWGDGTTEPVGDITLVEVPGSEGVLTTGTIQAMHAYADNGTYTVTVTVNDDDGGSASQMFEVTVGNVNPTLDPIENITADEGEFISLPPATFSDPGFDLAAAGTEENFTATIDWGDGTTEPVGDITLVEVPGSEGVLTTGTIQAMHAYADNGTYTVTVTVNDDDGGSASQMFEVTVGNVNPTLDPIENITADEGEFISLPPATFSDPGFDLAAAGTEENFTATIDWGDGTTEPVGDITLVEVPGSEGVLTTGTIQAMHAYADNGVYTVTVTVTDDDGGVGMTQFTVTVANVAPSLTGVDGTETLDEGEEFTLADFGLGISDPGFDNPLNVGGELQETFTGVSIDWGDGTAPIPVNVVNRISGSEGVLTTAEFDHAAHAYADNGNYTVTVTFSDDDGGVTAAQFDVTVNNVAPTLVLTDRVLVINEGDTLDLFDLGEFSDPGFDNPANPNGASVESFTYEITWEQRLAPESGLVVATEVDGMQGTPTTGTLADSHLYIDNDDDGFFTITVTITDDDGGSDTQQIVVQVNNLNPLLDPIAATDINTQGETVLTLTFEDIGIEQTYLTADANAFRIMIDWGYVGVPGMEGFIETVTFDGNTPETFVVQHTYLQPPNPMNPAADIILRVQVLDDDFGNALVMADGASNIEIVAITNPGIGGQPIAIDTTPQVPRLTFERTTQTALVFQFTTTTEAASTSGDIRAASSDSKATTEQILELRVIDSYGVESEGIRLKAEVLNNLPELFYKLPDNHYVIYLVRQETNSERLVIEIYLRGGRIIDPSDDSEGLRNRPPTEEKIEVNQSAGQDQQDPQVDAILEEVKETLEEELAPEGEIRIEPAQPVDPVFDEESNQGARRESSSTQMLTVATGLVATRSFGTWARRVDRTLAQADKKKWRQLRQRTRHKRKNR